MPGQGWWERIAKRTEDRVERWTDWLWDPFERVIDWFVDTWMWRVLVVWFWTAVTVGVIAGLWTGSHTPSTAPRPAPSLEERIRDLTSTLQTAAATITAVERDIQARQQLVDKLRADQIRIQQFRRVDKPLADAFAQELRLQVEGVQREADKRAAAASRRSLWLGAALGAVLSVALDRLVRWASRRRVQPATSIDSSDT